MAKDPIAPVVQGPDTPGNPFSVAGIDPNTGEPKGGGVTDLLARIVWELGALRKAYCDATGEFFQEYPE